MSKYLKLFLVTVAVSSVYASDGAAAPRDEAEAAARVVAAYEAEARYHQQRGDADAAADAMARAEAARAAGAPAAPAPAIDLKNYPAAVRANVALARLLVQEGREDEARNLYNREIAPAHEELKDLIGFSDNS